MNQDVRGNKKFFFLKEVSQVNGENVESLSRIKKGISVPFNKGQAP